MDENYFLLFKTADAEKRAWRNLNSQRRSVVTPIVELSRGKKKRNAGKDKAGKPLTAEQLLSTFGVYGFERNWQSSLEAMRDCDWFFLDLTREPSLSCAEIEALGNSANGYEKWTRFVFDRRKEGLKLKPTLLVNPAEDDDEAKYVSDLKAQFSAFSKGFKEIAYRVAVTEDDEFLFDLLSLKPEIDAFRNEGGRFFIILDHEYVRPGNGLVHAKRTAQVISSIYAELGDVEVVVLATSFPKSVTDVGDEEHDIFRVEEIYLYEEVKKTHTGVKYGDYGSINPIRNDEIIITQGWRPRIDFVSRHDGMHTYYFREKRKVVGTKEVVVKGEKKTKNVLAPYSVHYQSVATKVMGLAPYYQTVTASWGNDEIIAAAGGAVGSNSPSHWISVRMEIHISQVLKYFGCDPI
ncbi:beta family protein [Ruegeria sp. SCP11]|uniref:beta family protein n=1 Tax=Ruegeria sp. SCP11 TaxID=3141378 RepID=UPI003336A250